MPRNSPDSGSLGGLDLLGSQQTIHHQRQVYSVLDWLGDVGGLYSILISIGHLVVLLWGRVSGSGIDSYLID